MSSVEKASYEHHQLAWKNHADYAGYLNKAETILESEMTSGRASPVAINNYIAVLLDQNKNQQALAIAKKHEFNFSEYCYNRAIAIAKSAYNIRQIRKWNTKASKAEKAEFAIVAYVDWHGF